MIFDKRKQLVMSERTIRCRRTGVRITNRVEFNEDAVPQLVEYVTMETPESMLFDHARARNGVVTL